MHRIITLSLLSFTGTLLGAAPTRPNVLIILTDQQHAGMMSCTGNPDLRTPNMDALAARGARFERAYAANPVCIPSRFALMTGTMPSAIGMEQNRERTNAVSHDILSSSLGAVFKRAGYRTVYAGKKHLPGEPGVQENPKAYGFEEVLVPRDNHGRDPAVDACVRFLEQPQSKPFVLYASLVNPHDICYLLIRDYLKYLEKEGIAYKPGTEGLPPSGKFPEGFDAIVELDRVLQIPPGMSVDEFVEKLCPPLPANYGVPDRELSATWSDKPEFMLYGRHEWRERDWRLHRRAYAGLTERVDAQIGRILDALRKAGLAKNTLIVFSSDHGEQDGAHRVDEKAFLYEESVRIPFVVTWEGVIKPGLVDRTHLVSNGLDLLPTVCDFAGIPIPADAKGRSVRALAEGRPVQAWRDCLVVENSLSRLVQMGRWKYMVGHAKITQTREWKGVAPVAAVRESLVDLQTDPGEMRNLAGDVSSQSPLEQGRRLLREWYAAHGLVLDPGYVVGPPQK